MNKFNRILLASGLAATASLMANSPAFADTKTGTVNLSGTVATSLAMTVTPLSNATSLAMLPGVNYQDVKIGNITGATTNSANGFKVTVNSTWRFVSGGKE
jgi:type 1 fimbria pilin